MKPIVFSGSKSLNFAKELVKIQNWSLGKLELITFANSEIKIRVLSPVENKDVVFIHSIANPANSALVELLFTVDALKRQNAQSVTVVIPYFGYSRQNIAHLPGECVSLNVIVKVLEALRVDKVITLDIHDEASAGIFSIPFQNLTTLPFLAKKIKKTLQISKINEKDFVIASPDQGGVERARVFANAFYENKNHPEIVVVEKKRDLFKTHQSQAIAIFGEVVNKKIILVDDISTSGRTIINATKLCLQAGAKNVSAVVVHPDFALGVAKQIQLSELANFFTTNSIAEPIESLNIHSKFHIIDITSVLVF